MAETQETERYNAKKNVIAGTVGTAFFGLLSLSALYDTIEDFANSRYLNGTLRAVGTALCVGMTYFSHGTRKIGKDRLAVLEQKAKQETLEAKVE